MIGAFPRRERRSRISDINITTQSTVKTSVKSAVVGPRRKASFAPRWRFYVTPPDRHPGTFAIPSLCTLADADACAPAGQVD